MYSTQLKVYRRVRDDAAREDKIEATHTYIIEGYIEPAGMSSIAPFDASIGAPFNVYFQDARDMDIRDGYKIENASDPTDYYIITSIIEKHQLGGSFSYQLAVYKPKPDTIKV